VSAALQAANAAPAGASAASPASAAAPDADSQPDRLAQPFRSAPIPRLQGRLTAADLGLVINSADPASVALGEHYARRRGLRPEQVLRVELPIKPQLDRHEFAALASAIDAHFGPQTQALALAWTAPYRVECNAITAALTLGFDAEVCARTCAPSRPSRYFNSASHRPFTDLGLRPTMLIAARTPEQALALVDRGVAADHGLLRRGRPAVQALLLTSDDAARRVRQALYPPPGVVRGAGVALRVVPPAELPGATGLLLAQAGSVRVALEPAPHWVPGGLGDHLTSAGGDLLGQHGQGTVFDWIASGATASHGAVSEPCNHLQKFPHPQLLLGHYLQGATAIEAYWKSVAWPQQSLFVGEPLAAPFAPPVRAPSARGAAPSAVPSAPALSLPPVTAGPFAFPPPPPPPPPASPASASQASTPPQPR
jgi:uncharacterized protein (TIGR03790 family)